MPPPRKLGRSFGHTKRRRRPLFLACTQFWAKKLDTDFGQENRTDFGEKIFILIFVLLKFSEFPAPPFKILRTLPLGSRSDFPGVGHKGRRACSIIILLFVTKIITIPASWSSGNAFVSGAVGPRFKYRAGQIVHSVANGLTPLQHYFERSGVANTPNDAEMGPANSLHASA